VSDDFFLFFFFHRQQGEIRSNQTADTKAGCQTRDHGCEQYKPASRKRI
jgi:hypothetical protein